MPTMKPAATASSTWPVRPASVILTIASTMKHSETNVHCSR